MILIDLKKDLLIAQKAQDTLRLSVLRYLLAELKNREIQLRPEKKEMSDEEVVKVMRKQIKQREEVIIDFEKAKRLDLAQKERSEAVVLQEYLDKYVPFVHV